MGQLVHFVSPHLRMANLPAVRQCPECGRITRYYAQGKQWQCALCKPPRASYLKRLPLPPISGAKKQDFDWWLPIEAWEHDEIIMGRLLESWLSVESGCFHCPTHGCSTGDGLSARECSSIVGAESDEDSRLIGKALLWLIRQQRAYRFGAGKVGDPFRYSYRWEGCEIENLPAGDRCSLLPIQASTRVGA
jgi:hypothetical protein